MKTIFFKVRIKQIPSNNYSSNQKPLLKLKQKTSIKRQPAENCFSPPNNNNNNTPIKEIEVQGDTLCYILTNIAHSLSLKTKKQLQDITSNSFQLTLSENLKTIERYNAEN